MLKFFWNRILCKFRIKSDTFEQLKMWIESNNWDVEIYGEKLENMFWIDNSRNWFFFLTTPQWQKKKWSKKEITKFTPWHQYKRNQKVTKVFFFLTLKVTNRKFELCTYSVHSIYIRKEKILVPVVYFTDQIWTSLWAI